MPWASTWTCCLGFRIKGVLQWEVFSGKDCQQVVVAIQKTRYNPKETARN